MPYEVTATRKRPQLFDEVVGQEFVVATLRSSIQQGRIAHAYLFAGPRGVGKTSAARILAKALNCEEGATDSPCGECDACQEISRGTSLDVIEIDGASNTSVNDVREIKDEVLFSPNSCRYKIYIIDEVHMLSNSAFNALLKTIEEPPPYIVFIFATTEIHKVPATIRSRCQQFNFRLISIGDIREKLREVVEEMGVRAEDDALLWIARESTGSLRDAYTLLDQAISFSEGNITLEKLREKLGIVGMEELNTLFRSFVSGEPGKALELTDEILSRGVAVEQFVINLVEYFRNILFLQQELKTEAILGYSYKSFPKDLLRSFSEFQIEKALELLLDLYRKIRFSLNQRFELELVMSRLSRLKSLISHDDVLSHIRSIKREIAGQREASKQSLETSSGGSTDSAIESPSSVHDGEFVPGKSHAPIEGSGLAENRAPSEGSALSESHGLSEGSAAPESHAPSNVKLGVKDASTEKLQDSSNLTVDGSLESALVEEFRRKRPTLASALDKAEHWSISGRKLILRFDRSHRFSGEMVAKEKETVSRRVSEILGQPTQLLVIFEEEREDGQAASALDDRAEMVRKIFKGEIIQGD